MVEFLYSIDNWIHPDLYAEEAFFSQELGYEKCKLWFDDSHQYYDVTMVLISWSRTAPIAHELAFIWRTK